MCANVGENAFPFPFPPLYFSPFRNVFFVFFFSFSFLFFPFYSTESYSVCTTRWSLRERVVECAAANRTCHNNIMPILSIIHNYFYITIRFQSRSVSRGAWAYRREFTLVPHLPPFSLETLPFRFIHRSPSPLLLAFFVCRSNSLSRSNTRTRFSKKLLLRG